jgi:hypothetical protein
MPRQPLARLWMFVGVDDGVDHFSRRDLLLDHIEEADELLVAMVLHIAADDGAIEDVESCEQRGGAVTFVVMRYRPGADWLHGQSRLGAVECLAGRNFPTVHEHAFGPTSHALLASGHPPLTE